MAASTPFVLPSIRLLTHGISLLQSNNHAYTGSEGEPEDGPAVAASIYVAVLVYAVCRPLSYKELDMSSRPRPRIELILSSSNRVSSSSADSKPSSIGAPAVAVPYLSIKPAKYPSLSCSVSEGGGHLVFLHIFGLSLGYMVIGIREGRDRSETDQRAGSVSTYQPCTG